MSTQEVKLKRVQSNYQPNNARFLLECDFSKQYCNYYRKRLERTRPYLEINCRSKWDQGLPLMYLSELAALVDLNDLNDDDEHQDIDSPSQSPETATSGSFKFAKRMRKYSSGSQPQPTTSTQKNEGDTSPDDWLNSPIVGQQPRREMSINRDDDDDETGLPSKDVIVIGTIFKRMKLQPDVVEELSRGDFHINIDRYLGHYTSQDDRLVLEDAEESISLVGNIEPGRFVTGVVVGLLGTPIEGGGEFLVKDICYAEPNRQILYEVEFEEESRGDQREHLERPLDNGAIYLMLVSGLGFHQEMGKRSMLTRALQDLIDFIWGGGKFSEDLRSSRVARILVAGDSLLEDRLYLDDDQENLEGYKNDNNSDTDIGAKMKRSRQVKQYKESILAVRHMDDFFAQLSKTIYVDVMPGATDPSSHLMPQQPFHPCMFPKSCMFPTFNCITNPHHATYHNDIEILATSGQNIDIISKFSDIKDPIEAMKCHLKWGNLAPSAPDNLYSVPYENDDPYVIDFIPEIYIAGSQKSYKIDYYDYSQPSDSPSCDRAIINPPVEAGIPKSGVNEDGTESPSLNSNDKDCSSLSNVQSTPNIENEGRPVIGSRGARKGRTLLVTIPKFYETFSCVLINLKNLESSLISFRSESQ